MYHKGKPQANEICARPLEERFEGTVMSLFPGYIEGTEVMNQFWKEVYFKAPETIISGSSHGLEIGTTVSFKVRLAFQSQIKGVFDGTPEAVDVKIESAPSNDTQKQYSGRVKILSAYNPFGYIECLQTMQEFRKDVYLPHNELRGLQVGMHVTFKVYRSSKGPQAVDVQSLQHG